MKAAKAKEAASLPKQPVPAQSRAMPDLEKGEGEGTVEQQALLQVLSLIINLLLCPDSFEFCVGRARQAKPNHDETETDVYVVVHWHTHWGLLIQVAAPPFMSGLEGLGELEQLHSQARCSGLFPKCKGLCAGAAASGVCPDGQPDHLQ